MNTHCRTCAHRASDLEQPSCSHPSITLTLLTLRFIGKITSNTALHTALQETMRSIAESPSSPSYLTRFTSWSPAKDNPSIALILSTTAEDHLSPSSSMFAPVEEFLVARPEILRMDFEREIMKLAAMRVEERIPIDVFVLRAPNSEVAGAMGKMFGWGTKQSKLSVGVKKNREIIDFGDQSDLVRDYCAWADGKSSGIVEKSGGLTLRNTDANEEVDFKGAGKLYTEEMETYVMMFQWKSRSDGERFKDPTTNSFGVHGEAMAKNTWDVFVNYPVKRLQDLGAKVETFRAELRGVEPWEEAEKRREEAERKSEKTSRRLSILGGKVMSGFWR